MPIGFHLGEPVKIGTIYTGKVTRIEDYGVFVELTPGTDGMVHVSQLADFVVKNPRDVCKLGDDLMVMVVNVDEAGKIRLSRQAVLEGWTAEEAREKDRKPSGSGGGNRDDRRSGGRPRGSRVSDSSPQDRRSPMRRR